MARGYTYRFWVHRSCTLQSPWVHSVLFALNLFLGQRADPKLPLGLERNPACSQWGRIYVYQVRDVIFNDLFIECAVYESTQTCLLILLLSVLASGILQAATPGENPHPPP